MAEEKNSTNQWFSDNSKEIMAKGLCYVTITAACCGAAASSFLAIPGLFSLLSITPPNYILNTIYSIAIINGVTFSISQFWESLVENTRVNVFNLPPSTTSINTINLKIEKIQSEIINSIQKLQKIGINANNNELMKQHLNSLKLLMSFNDEIIQESSKLADTDKSIKSNSFYHNLMNALYYVNCFFAAMVISTGIFTSVILTILGTTNAINTIAPMILGSNTLSNVTITFMAGLVAFCSQYCKSSTFGQKQWSLLVLDIFGINLLEQEESLTPKDLYKKLQNSLIDINEIYIAKTLTKDCTKETEESEENNRKLITALYNSEISKHETRFSENIAQLQLNERQRTITSLEGKIAELENNINTLRRTA